MKIAYIAQVDVAQESGISKKIIAQVVTWRRAGHDARLFLMTRSAKAWSAWDEVDPTVFRYQGHLSGAHSARRLAEAATGWGLDGAYFRMGTCYPAFLRLARRRPFVLEVNTDDASEARARWGALKAHLYMAGVRSMRRRAAGAVCVSREIATGISDSGLRVLTIANGIEVERYPNRQPPSNPAPRLIFVGSAGCAWHGVDKLSHIGQRFPEWTIDVVGMERSAASVEMPRNVVFHGFLGEDGYRPLLERADVAIGALALHRLGMNESSSLKVREYLAMGLPVVLGNPDTDLKSGSPFVLPLRNCEENVQTSLDLIEEFVLRWRGRTVDRHEIEHLDVSVKERKRLSFMEQVFADHGRKT